MALVATLQIVKLCFNPKPWAWRKAAKVSAVSPLWVMVTTKVRGLGTESR